MLTATAIGMSAYGVYAAIVALLDLLSRSRLEVWSNLLAIFFGAVLVLAAAFVRIMMPGGLALAIGAMLGLQALSLHDAAHLYGAIALAPQIARGIFAAALAWLGWAGSRSCRMKN